MALFDDGLKGGMVREIWKSTVNVDGIARRMHSLSIGN